MEKYQKLKKFVSVVHIVLLVLVLILSVWLLLSKGLVDSKSATAAMKVTAVLCILTSAFSGIYVLKGAGKDAAKYYKLFTAFFAVTEFVAFIGVATVNNDLMRILVSALILGLILVLAVGKDLGRELSLSICIVLIIAAVLKTAYCIYNVPELFTDREALFSPSFIHNISAVILSFVPLLMTTEKYIDKSRRNTK